ncbi:MAG: AAA family ATPase [Ruminococcus sp.]|nr:AAA family ATPase [Ruminococcus sp.]
MNKTKLAVIDGETLMDMRLPPTKFCIDQILPQGVAMISGAPKVGKSWLMLDWTIRIAKGEEVWNFKTTKGTTLYLCLEDNWNRVQNRLFDVTDEAPSNAFFAISSCSIADGLLEQIEGFVSLYPDTVLVTIDTFQMIRNADKDTSYSNDYQEIEKLKVLADKLQITILLVHHLRKQGDSDPLNKISGTTGISGALDTTLILDRSNRNQKNAKLICTGRDIEDRELELNFSKDTHTWDLVSDSIENPESLLPEEISQLIAYMKQIYLYVGSNSEFAKDFSSFCGNEINPSALKRLMNKYRFELEENEVYFRSSRSNGKRFLNIRYKPDSDESDVSDAEFSGVKNAVNLVPVVPVYESG